MPDKKHTHPYYGLLAEFEGPKALRAAVQQAYAAGYRHMDAYTPYPMEELAEDMGVRGTRLPLIILAGGLAGAIGGFLMQWYASAISYPINAGGRPLNSWPAYIPITFELAILAASFAAVLGMFALNSLPQPYHPVFNVERFELASRSHFFLAIESSDRLFDPEKTRQFLETLNPTSIEEVEY